MNDNFKIVSEAIKKRRTIKPVKMNGKMIPNELFKEILALGDWAPTHKMTEPWRFIVYEGDKARKFAREHAELYKEKAEKFDEAKYEKIIGNGNNVSHIVVAVMKRSQQVDIPEIEEICASAAAIENILIGAAAAGIASYWSTGGMAHKKPMKKFLSLKDEDIVMGILYFGYSDIVHTGKRVIPIEEKITWK